MYNSEMPKQQTKCMKTSIERKHNNSCINFVFLLNAMPHATIIIKMAFTMFFQNTGYFTLLIMSCWFKLHEWNRMLSPNMPFIRPLILEKSALIQYLYSQYIVLILLAKLSPPIDVKWVLDSLNASWRFFSHFVESNITHLVSMSVLSL